MEDGITRTIELPNRYDEPDQLKKLTNQIQYATQQDVCSFEPGYRHV